MSGSRFRAPHAVRSPMRPDPHIRNATRDDVADLALALARAYHRDPVWSFLLPREPQRERALRRYFTIELRDVALRHDTTWTPGRDVGAILCMPPGQWRVPAQTMVGRGPAFVHAFGTALPRSLRALLLLERAHPRAAHYFIAYAGIVPEWQGQGVGGALVAPLLERCDAEQAPGYLEATSERAARFYERHGFTVTDEIRLKNGPPLWLMWREPLARELGDPEGDGRGPAIATVTVERPVHEPAPRVVRAGGRGRVREIEQVRSQARAFAARHVRPRALGLDQRCGAEPAYFDWDLVRAGADHGMLGLLTPRPAGGAGGLSTHTSVMMEELCAACPGIGLIFGANALGMSPLLFSPPHWYGVLADVVAAGRAGSPQLMALAVTEPEAGSDMENPDLIQRGRVSSHARRVAGGFRLSGTKRFISNGNVARWLTVATPTDPRRPRETLTWFLVDSRSKGFSVLRTEHKMGQRACPAAELAFDGMFVPDEQVIGREGDGVSIVLTVLACSRPAVGAIAAGIARGAYERVRDWLEHDPAAHGLLAREHVQLELAAMAEEIHLARQAYLDAATELDIDALGGALSHPIVRSLECLPASIGRRATTQRVLASEVMRDFTVRLLHRTTDDRALTRSLALSSLAKARAADVAMRVTSAALELIGLRGGRVRSELEKLWRDAKLTQIYEGTNQINRLDVYHGLANGDTLPCLPTPPRRWWMTWP